MVVERYAYTPYGERRVLAPDGVTIRQLSAYGNPLGHQGLYHDDETGLIYNRWRYFVPDHGRFASRDWLEYWDSLSMYEYLRSEVYYWLDPSGLKSLDFGFGFDQGIDKSDIPKVMEQLQDQLDALDKAISKCCEKFDIGCDIDSINSHLDHDFKPRPDDASYDFNDPEDIEMWKNNLNSINPGIDKPFIPVLMTGGVMNKGKHAGWGAKNIGLMLPYPIPQPDAPFILPHELGHYCDYTSCNPNPNPKDPHHNLNPSNLMASKLPSAPVEVDECWCKKMAEKAND